ncbi:LbetaH domain-containing protein [Perlucidibaca aquatica]|uniref:hypothetical protein n=1 Tax=Perlucidibaca aquatica TaxID=1852776 RepID=UPI0009ECC865|nr:hypothetical protein [Perlucidibaca aquatica]
MKINEKLFSDPFRRPAHSMKNKIMRVIWSCVYFFLFRPSPRLLFNYRSMLLRLFGATIGHRCAIYPKAIIWAPWNLCCEDAVAIADYAEIYNPALVTLRSHAIVSQGAYICTASHKINSSDFELFSKPVIIGRYAWVSARASVLPGVVCEDGSVLGLGAVTSKNLMAWTVYVGNPCRKVSDRKKTNFL